MRTLFWPVVFGALFGAAMYYSFPAHADDLLDPGFLGVSTQTLVVGPTGEGEPNAAYIADAESLYINSGNVTDVNYAAGDNFGPSVTQGENALTTMVETDYKDGLISPSDPLTLFGYSQGSVVITDDETTLKDYGIPSDDLRILLIGDTASSQHGWDGAAGPVDGYLDNTTAPGTYMADLLQDFGWGNLVGNTTPDNLFPTEVVTIYGDNWADVPGESAPYSAWIHEIGRAHV